MKKAQTHEQKLLALIKQQGVLRSCDLKKYKIPRVFLTRLVKQNHVEKIARGLYRSPEFAVSENDTLLQVMQKTPNAVICLLSALQFHALTTQMPRAVWIAMPRGSHTPVIDYPPIKMIQFSKKSYLAGIQVIKEKNLVLRIYNPAKTIADCFKHRRKIGLDVAIEALKSAIDAKKATYDELFYYAKINRVQNIMKPYLESIA